MKFKNLGFYNKETGKSIDMSIEDILKHEKDMDKVSMSSKLRRLVNDPDSMSMDELKDIFRLIKFDKDRIGEFQSYHRTNDTAERRLLNSGIKPNTYFYFKRMVVELCSMTYTLCLRNGRHISNDSQIYRELSLSRPQWQRIKRELIELSLIREVTLGKKKRYKINPCYIGKQKILSEHTYDAFRDDLIKYEMVVPIQVLYWDKFMKEEYGIEYGRLLE